jgi:hypothetical protein
MKAIVADTNLIAYCGLYCGACRKYLVDKCPGCRENEKAAWCKIRLCCIEKEIKSCADCDEFRNVMDCKKYNNFMARIFGLIFRSDRKACIQVIKDKGYDTFAAEMAEKRIVTIKR